jgi:hypothetical protein
VIGVLGADGQAIDNVLRLVEVEYSQELEAGHVTIHSPKNSNHRLLEEKKDEISDEKNI